MSISEEFKKRFCDLVEELDCKRTKLPKLLGVDGAILSKALNYGIIPRPRTLIKLADFFSVSIKYLLGQSEDSSFEPSAQGASFFSRLEQLRIENDITTYYKLAELTHISRSYFTTWKKTSYIPELELLQILADFFSVPLDYLLGRTDEK